MILQVLFILTLVLLASTAYAGIQGAPWVPTWKRDMKRIGRLLRLQPGERFVELGCGNARVCRYLKREQPEADVVGVELSMLQYGIGWLQNRLTSSGVNMKLKNAFKHDLRGYDAVYLFLMPETYKKIRPKLEAELHPGARVVSYVWPIPGWQATRVDELEGAPKLYYYERFVPTSDLRLPTSDLRNRRAPSKVESRGTSLERRAVSVRHGRSGTLPCLGPWRPATSS